MKIAEALQERAALEEKIRHVTGRAHGSARFAEGEEPSEDAAELIAEVRQYITQRSRLVSRINHTNAQAEVTPGVTITGAIAERERLSAEIKLLRNIATEAVPGRDPYGRGRRRTELAEKTSLPVKELYAEADRLSAQHRELDVKIQQANWSTELL